MENSGEQGVDTSTGNLLTPERHETERFDGKDEKIRQEEISTKRSCDRPSVLPVYWRVAATDWRRNKH